MKDSFTPAELFAIRANELTSHRIQLAKAEGDLMTIAALRRLDLDNEKDEDGFENYVWKLANVAASLAELFVRGLVPESWKEIFSMLCDMGREINKAAWEFFYVEAVKVEQRFIAMENSDIW